MDSGMPETVRSAAVARACAFRLDYAIQETDHFANAGTWSSHPKEAAKWSKRSIIQG